MKKSLLTLGILFASYFGFSQSHYISLQGGYHFGLPSDNLTSSNISFAGSKINSDGSTENLFGTLGKGVPVNLAVGRMFNEYIGVELGFNYLFGSSVLLGEDNFEDGSTGKAEAKTSQFRLMPQLVAKYNGLYSKAGIIIPVAGKTVLSVEETNLGITTSAESKITGKATVGFTAAIGYEHALSEKLGLFGELQYIGMNIKSNKAEITKYEVAGNDFLETLPDGIKNTEYVDELSAEDAANPLSGKELAFKRSYSSFGINLGIKFNL